MSETPPSPLDSDWRSGATIHARGDIVIQGDVIGRDKIVNNIQHIYERALTAAEAAEKAQAVELRHLAHGVQALAQRLQARAGETAYAGKPYRGLLEYRLNDAEIFHGREAAVQALAQCLQTGSFVALHAESGAGKTSLLQAGLQPRLIGAGHLPVLLRPYDVEPALAIKRAFLPDLSLTPGLAAAPLREVLRRVTDVLGPRSIVFIGLDQFEEFFTQLEAAEQQAFLVQLAECLDDDALNVRWVVSLRTEFFGSLSTFRPHVRNPFANELLLQRLTAAEARQVMTEPATRRGLGFEPGLVEALLADLGGDTIAPAQLQLVCLALYDDLGQAGVFTRALYDQAGGVAGILRGHLERVLERQLPSAQRQTARQLLEALVSSDQRRVRRTRAALTGEVERLGATPETTSAVLATLVDSHLLTVFEEGAEPVYELAHDYLLDQIRLDPEVQARKAAQELLAQEVRAFERHGTLLTADRLAAIEPHLKALLVSAAAEDLLAQSRASLARQAHEAAAEAEREQRLANRYLELEQGRIQKQRPQKRTAAGCLTQGLGQYLAFVFLAVIGCACAYSLAPGFVGSLGRSFSPDWPFLVGAVLASAAIPTVAINVLSNGRKQLRRQRVQALAFTPDSQSIVTGYEEGGVEVWSLTGEKQAGYATRGGAVHGLTPVATGHMLSIGQRGAVWLWDGRLTTQYQLQADELEAVLTGGGMSDIARLTELQRLASVSARADVTATPGGDVIAAVFGVDTIGVWGANGQALAQLRPATRVYASETITLGRRRLCLDTAGRYLLVLSAHGAALLFETAGKFVGVLDAQPRGVSAAAISPDGQRCWTGGPDGSLVIWDTFGRVVKHPRAHPGAVCGIAYSPDNRRVVTADHSGNVWFWDQDGEWLGGKSHAGAATSVTFSPDGRQVLTTGRDGRAYVWRALDGSAQCALIGHRRPIVYGAISPDGQKYATISTGDKVMIWDAAGHVLGQMRLA